MPMIWPYRTKQQKIVILEIPEQARCCGTESSAIYGDLITNVWLVDWSRISLMDWTPTR